MLCMMHSATNTAHMNKDKRTGCCNLPAAAGALELSAQTCSAHTRLPGVARPGPAQAWQHT